MKSGFRDALWAVPGAALFILIGLIAFHYYRKHDAAAQIASKAQRVEIVSGMRLDLASASAAAKSAVMAVTDEDSRAFADQARTAAATVERKAKELLHLLNATGTDREKELLSLFEKAFTDFQRIDEEMLSLAVKNTNIKASDLAFGPAAAALHDMDGALSHVVTKGSGSPQARTIERLAHGAQVGAWRVQALLAPHIAEKSDERMDEIEARIATENETVEKNLAELERLLPGPDVPAARKAYAHSVELRARILALSRENTNVRSSALSVDQDTRAMLRCQDALAALQEAIRKEPVAGIDYGQPESPR